MKSMQFSNEETLLAKDKRIVIEHIGVLSGLCSIIGTVSNTPMTPGATVLVEERKNYLHYREVEPSKSDLEADGA